MISGLDLFSGIGGISLAIRDWVRPIAYCESDRYAQSVLLSRMQSGDISTAPIWDDVRTLRVEMLPDIDIVYGGFPCHDISTAGLGKGLDGERSGLFFEMHRLISEIRPLFVFLENVPAIRTRGAERVGKELAAIGYDCRWDTLSAYDVGAPHERERWFLLAHRKSLGRDERVEQQKQEGKPHASKHAWWLPEPDVARVANGVPKRVDRTKCLGNAVVPEQAKEAFKRLMGIK